MSRGKRVASKKSISHGQPNDMSQTGKLSQHSFRGDNADYPVVKNNGTTINIYTSEKLLPCPNCNRNYTQEPKKSSKFNLWECIAIFLLSSIVGMLLYNRIAPLVIYMSHILVVIATILPLESSSTWVNSRRPIQVGLVLSILFLALVCGYFGLRLRLIPATANEPIAIPTVESTPMPTPTPTSILPGIESNPDTKDPIIVTPNPNQETITTQYVRIDFFELLPLDIAEQNTLEFNSSNIHLCKATFIDEIKKTVSTEESYDTNSSTDKSFQDKTKLANDLYDQLAEQPNKIEAIELIIQHRIDAYNITPMSSLCSLLADDYYRLALEYKKIEDQENTYQCYYNAVKWELAYIRSLKQIDDNFYSALYFIATAYYGIGNSEWLPDVERIDAYYISACLFGAASQNIFTGGDKQYLSCIYAGMVNHNLLNLNADIAPSESAAYFVEAYNYYIQAVDFPSKDKKHIYGYLSQICTWAEQYSMTHPGSLPFDSITYRDYADKYKQLSV